MERRVLRLLVSRCTFGVPRILYEAADGEFDVRTAVKGVTDPPAIHALVCEKPDVAESLGTAIGQLLAEQHSRIKACDVSGWLPTKPIWPQPTEWVRDRLTAVVDDTKLRSRADEVMLAYESQAVDESEMALAWNPTPPANLTSLRATA